MAEYALGLLRQRAREAFEQKIPVACEVGSPCRVCRTEDDRIEKSADVSPARDCGVFAQLHALGRARQTTLWDRDAQLPLPRSTRHRGAREHLALPRGHRMNQILTNPVMRGAGLWRTAAKVVIEAGRAPPHAAVNNRGSSGASS